MVEGGPARAVADAFVTVSDLEKAWEKGFEAANTRNLMPLVSKVAASEVSWKTAPKVGFRRRISLSNTFKVLCQKFVFLCMFQMCLVAVPLQLVCFCMLSVVYVGQPTFSKKQIRFQASSQEGSPSRCLAAQLPFSGRNPNPINPAKTMGAAT